MHIHTDTPAAGPLPFDRSPVPHRVCRWWDKTQAVRGRFSFTTSPSTAGTLSAEVIVQLAHPGVGSPVLLPVESGHTRTSAVQLSVQSARDADAS